MNKLLTDNRAASILRLLGTRSGMSVAELAGKLSVSERTIRNDIKQLNSDLKDSARLEGVQGRYHLRIFDPVSYKKEYGEDTIEIHADAIEQGDVVLIQDDLLATGGSMLAVCKLCQQFNPSKIYVNFLIEINNEGLNGRKALEGFDFTTLMTIPEKE